MINNDGEKGCLNQCIRMEETAPKKDRKTWGGPQSPVGFWMSDVWSSNIARKRANPNTLLEMGHVFFFWGSKRFEAQFNFYSIFDIHYIPAFVYTVYHVICTCYIKFNDVSEFHVPAIFVAGQCIQVTNR